MIRYLLVSLFIIPKIVFWPLIWLYRCRLKKRDRAAKQEESAKPLTAPTEDSAR